MKPQFTKSDNEMAPSLHKKKSSVNRLSLMLLLSFLILGILSINTINAQSISTDRSDYWPGSKAVFTGSGFTPGESVTISVTKANGDPWFNSCITNWVILADGSGNFTTNWYVCLESLDLTLIASAEGQSSGMFAQTVFTDAAANLDQARNGSASSPTNPIAWVNGNAGSSNSHYVEGYSVPYRIVVTGLAAGTHTLDIEWDTRHSSANAIDFITTYNRLEPHITQYGHEAEDIDPLYSTGLVAPSLITFPVPAPIVNTTAGTVGGLSQPISAFNALPAL